jgi:malonyl-CoA O-methyltransferase
MDDPLHFVREGYDRWSVLYDHDTNPLPALEEPVVRRLVGDVRGLRALDLGCGTGRHARWLARAGARVVAIDFSAGMLAQARAKIDPSRVHFGVADLNQPLPLAPRSFGLVVSGLVLEHLRDLDHFFHEVRHMLEPSGRAVVSAMHPAMFLRGSQARFTDPDSGEVVQVGSLDHAMGDMVLAVLRAGLHLEEWIELAPDAAFADDYPRAEKYVGWPMLVVMALREADSGA